MRRYRRNREGRLFFFTVVTHERRNILTSELARNALREAIQEVRQRYPFVITAIVLLPDHLHTIWELPPGENDYSLRWRLIKTHFTKLWMAGGGSQGLLTQSRRRSGEQAVWQRRFYEHTCRDEQDVTRCVEYIHVNPVKHQLVKRVSDWPWSSFHRYVQLGLYPHDWGGSPEMYGDEFLEAE
ncbi:REP-associated tyrosine transposase [Planctomicrobium sp. SH527]|uniref:REP-associated tyrosine transposase n=1 Tax=Planctomicrobium sp. SH527 TaxID=3448123 RepID=UPI003F5B4C51